MRDLPKGWKEIQLQKIVKTRKGKKPNVLQVTQADGLIPYLDIHAIEKNVSRQFADVQTSRIGTKGDIFIVWDGARSGWVGLGKDGAIGSTITALETLEADQHYLFYFLKSQFDYINSNTRGTGIPHVDPNIFNNIEVPLAPTGEQKRIVEKLEKLLGKVEAAQARLDKIPAILKRFRQAVLAAACSGKLTADWRENNEINLETDLPKTWNTKTIRELELFIGSGITPRGGREVYVNEGVPFIRSQNVYPSGLILEDVAYVTTEMHKAMARTHLKPKDILLNITGASIGRSTVIPENFLIGNVNQHVCIIRLEESALPEFVSKFLNSRAGQDLIFETQSGVTREGLNYGQIRSFEIPLPPLEEQKEIVRRVEDLFKFADQIEARLQKARSYTDKLTQSILAKAFRGELVPQDDADEPASVLLKRIREEKSATPTKSHKKSRQSIKTF